MDNEEKWHHRYLELAKLVSTWSKDPSTKCGAVIVNPNNEIVSIGFNGLPKDVTDDHHRLHTRETKLEMIIHAEQNAIVFARQPLHNCTMYTWPMHACSHCAGLMIQAGIKQHVTTTKNLDRWTTSFALARQMFKEANVKLLQLVRNDHEFE